MNPYRQTFLNRARPHRNPAFARRMEALRVKRMPAAPIVVTLFAPDVAAIGGMLAPAARAAA